MMLIEHEEMVSCDPGATTSAVSEALVAWSSTLRMHDRAAHRMEISKDAGRAVRWNVPCRALGNNRWCAVLLLLLENIGVMSFVHISTQ